MNKTNASWAKALGAALLLLAGGTAAQQQIGNGVWICDGAAQAGHCQAEGDDDSSSGSSSGGYTDNDYAHAEPKWTDRWGAVASNGRGIFGIVDTKDSKLAAQQAAVLACRNRGGGQCVVRHAYYNQCMAVAASSSGSNNVSAETVEKAKALALRDCQAEYGSGACHIYYSGCSLPERIQ